MLKRAIFTAMLAVANHSGIGKLFGATAVVEPDPVLLMSIVPAITFCPVTSLGVCRLGTDCPPNPSNWNSQDDVVANRARHRLGANQPVCQMGLLATLDRIET